MYPRLFVALLLGATSLASCSTDSGPADNAAAPPAASTPDPVAAAAPARAVRIFLDWYAARVNQPGLYEEFVAHADTADDLNYAVDFRATEAWLTGLRRTAMFSAAYTNGWRQYFQDCADTLRRNPQNDGPPYGFDYDFFMLSQEPDEVVTDLQAGTFQTQMLGPKRARVQARGPRHESWQHGLDFVLSQAPDRRWQIDSISNAGQTF